METLTQEKIEKIVKDTNLNHIAIIMDGNRRWAKEHFLPSMMGHKKGVEALKKVTRACDDFGVKYLTLYAFSTENWNRKQEEVDFLMDLLATTLKSELKELNENNVKMNFIGDLTALNQNLQNILAESKETTKDNTSGEQDKGGQEETTENVTDKPVESKVLEGFYNCTQKENHFVRVDFEI